MYEEEYLVNSVGRLVQRVNTVGDEVGRLVVGLMRRGMRERARAVDAAMEDLVALCREAVVEVFGARAGTDVVTEEDKEGTASEASPHPDFLLIKPFTRLSLLG